MTTRVYVASSWRNPFQQDVVQALRAIPDMIVYDFREPTPGDTGFHWSDIEPDWQNASVSRFVEILDHKLAEEGFANDMQALNGCDVCVLVLPCGRSAHLELGHVCGAGKRTAIFYPPNVNVEPELMYKMCDLVTDDPKALRDWLVGEIQT